MGVNGPRGGVAARWDRMAPELLADPPTGGLGTGYGGVTRSSLLG
jgi:hypothetical protein